MILNNQKAIYDKASIGYKPNNKQKLLKKFFTKSSSSYTNSHITYFNCDRVGHKAHVCNLRKFSNENTII